MVDSHDLAWGIIYTEPGSSGNTGPTRQLEWMVSHWHPDPELQDLFQRIGRDKHGEGLRELWTQDISGDSRVYREWFEEFVFPHDPGRILPSR